MREFLVSHQRLQAVFGRFREGELRFHHLESLVAWDGESALYRLKDACHAFAREASSANDPALMRRTALLDVAVGALYHESMKLRENLYQQEVYAPKIRSLRSEDFDGADGFFREFEKMLAMSVTGLAESAQESEALLVQARSQLRLLLASSQDDGLVARYLIERRSEVGAVFPDGLDVLLAEIHGAAAAGYLAAAESYLESAFYAEALDALDAANARSPLEPADHGLSALAEGMLAFLEGRYDSTVERLGSWLDAGSPDARALRLAQGAVARIPHLTSGAAGTAPNGSDSQLVAAAAALCQRIERLS